MSPWVRSFSGSRSVPCAAIGEKQLGKLGPSLQVFRTKSAPIAIHNGLINGEQTDFQALQEVSVRGIDSRSARYRKSSFPHASDPQSRRAAPGQFRVEVQAPRP